jgi:simple sugar transport system ATP-binding protein
VGILYVGEDLAVLMSLCDRILIMYEGRVNGIVDPESVTIEDIGLLMMGADTRTVKGASL